MSSLYEAWRSAAPKSVKSPYMICQLDRATNQWKSMPKGSRPIDSLLNKLRLIGATQEQIASATCPCCGELHLDQQGNSTWAVDMGWQACSNPYCGGI